ncbi:AF4/FMR2 family member 1 [Strigops habroptila]|uniref:AF4/FMR2 family member 1 n=1 Tax=Strigops habroptila TaxID=2489341 RepID=UPI0011CF6B5D|nr:AF4/FMR2 family member 1 [Strigops habroptila]
MAAQSSLYNEERNLLRARERERRNREAQQEKNKLPEKPPLFAAPYKTNKGDDLSNRIQNMLGNYEEVKELIGARTQRDFLGLQEVLPLIPEEAPGCPYFPENTSHTLPSSFHHTTHRPPMGPTAVTPPPPRHSAPYEMAQSRTKPAPSLHAKSHSLSNSQSQSQERSCADKQSYEGFHHKGSDRRAAGEGHANERDYSIFTFSSLLTPLPSPLEPLSPQRSNQHVSSKSGNSNKSHELTYSQTKSFQNLGTGSEKEESQDSSGINPNSISWPSSQTFPSALPSQTNAMQQKPTAYVKPMDGQDQPPEESPDLKPLLEEYHREPFEKSSDSKVNARAKLSKSEIPSEPIKQTFPCDVHTVDEILKEMTQSWPPLLTDIPPSPTAEPSKFPLPTEESQNVGSVAQNQKHYDAPSDTLPRPQTTISLLQEDLQLSDSEESGDDQVADNPPASLAPPSAQQSQPKTVASAHSSSSESGSTSDSDSSSDSESSDSEAKEPSRASSPEPDPPTSSKWQLDNWLTKVNPPAVPTESLREIAHGDRHEKSKEQGISSNSSHQHAKPREPNHKSSGQVARAPQDTRLPSKQNCQKSSVCAEETSLRQTLGIKKLSKALVHKEPEGGLKVKCGPDPFKVRDQSSRDKPEAKPKEKPKSSDRKDLKPGLQQDHENEKHNTSHKATAKPFWDPKLRRDILPGSGQEHVAFKPPPQSQGTTPTSTSSHKPAVAAKKDSDKEKLPLPLKKSLSPVKDSPDLVVKIKLPFLSRVPQPPGEGSQQKTAEAKEVPGARNQDLERKITDTPNKSLQKKKVSEEEEMNRKKVKSEKETKSLKSSAKKDSNKLKASKSKASPEAQKKDLLPPSPVSPAHPAPKSTKVAQKRPRNESDQPTAMDNTAKNKSNDKDPLISKHRKVESNQAELSKDIKGSAGHVTKPFPVPSLPNGTFKPKRPRLKFKRHLKYPAEYYLEEARRLKHKADAMTDKTAKAFRYLESALFFIEYGIALESDAQNSAYRIFQETIDFIKFIMTLKYCMSSSASPHEEIFAVLCMRCQSLLQMAMFRDKKEIAVKYSRILNDHFKRFSTKALSPFVARSTGMASPFSPMPSPASSQPGSNASNYSGNSMCSPSTVSCNIPDITHSYVTITSYVLSALANWEQADALILKHKKFFEDLDAASDELSLTSSLIRLVHYVRQGLCWLRLETKMP